MSETDPIPPIFQDLIQTVYRNHESMGGEQRQALAEIQVRSILATNHASDVYLLASEKISEVYRVAGEDLKNATIGLKRATWGLAAATLILGLITAFVK